MRQEKKRRNNCNQPSRSRETIMTEPLEKEVQQTAEQFGMKIVSFEKQVGYSVTYKGKRDRTNQNKRTDEATRTVARIARLPRGFGFEVRARLFEASAIPRDQFAIECGMPSEQSQGGLTSQIMRTLWPTGANMRSKEFVLAVLVKGHRTDPVQVWAYQTLTTLKTMLRSNETWSRYGDRHGKPCRKEGSHQVQRAWQPTRTECSGDVGERTRGENSRRRKVACHPVSRRLLEEQHSASGARMEAPTSSKQKSSKRPKRNLTSKCPLDC